MIKWLIEIKFKAKGRFIIKSKKIEGGSPKTETDWFSKYSQRHEKQHNWNAEIGASITLNTKTWSTFLQLLAIQLSNVAQFINILAVCANWYFFVFL